MLIIYGFLIAAGLGILYYLKLNKKKTKLTACILSERIVQAIKKIYPEQEALKQAEAFCEKKMRFCLLILCIGALTAFVCEWMSIHSHYILNGNQIERNNYGEGEKQVWIFAAAEGDNWKDKIKLPIMERKYTAAEINRLAEEAENDLVKIITGGNDSLDYVTENLNLQTSLKGYPFKIKWSSERPLILSNSGKLNYERLKELDQKTEGILVPLTAELCYEEFFTVVELCVRVFPPKQTGESLFSEQLKNAIDKEDTASKTERFLQLPLKVGDTAIEYREIQKKDSIYILLISLIAGIAVYFRKDQELQQLEKCRNEEMLRDYPRIINKYALYYSAGMTTKTIWQKLCTDYQVELIKNGKKHYVYEEMLRANERIRDGMGEMAAYEKFAMRCQLQKYRVFVSLIEQSLQKGKENMIELLEKEGMDAFTERKNRAKVLGEEAGTKLLVPMFFMLFIVLFMITVPAFLNFRM